MSDAIKRVEEADEEAFQSMYAFALGPDVFMAHMHAKVDLIRERIRQQYVFPGPTPAEPGPAGEGGLRGGAGEPPQDA